MLFAAFICIGSYLNIDPAFPPKHLNENCNLSLHIVRESTFRSVHPFITLAMIHNESRWNPEVVSPRGACGLMQVVPAYTFPRYSCDELKHPIINISAGLDAVSYWLGRTKRRRFSSYKKYISKALNCYSSGNNCNHPSYPRRIFKIYDRLMKKYNNFNPWRI